MRALYAAVFLFAASGSAHAGIFGFGKQPTATQKAACAVRMSNAVAAHGHEPRFQANEKLIAHDAKADATVEQLSGALHDLAELSQKSGWRAMNRSVGVFRDARQEAERAIKGMENAKTPAERSMYIERARAAHAIAQQAVQIRQSLGQHGPRIEPGSERWRMGEIARAIGVADDDPHHAPLHHHNEFGANNAFFNNSPNRTAFQQTFSPNAPVIPQQQVVPPAPPPM